MQSSPLNYALNPNPEIDIMETFDYTKMTSTLHTWHQNPSIHLQRGTKGWKTGLEDISADYHTYECFILGKHTARNDVAGISPLRREFQKC